MIVLRIQSQSACAIITHSNESPMMQGTEMLKKWTGMVEWTMEFLCKVEGTIACGVLAVVVFFHPVRPQLRLLYYIKIMFRAIWEFAQSRDCAAHS